MDKLDKFHEHLDECHTCANLPLNLCEEGRKLLIAAASQTG